MPRTRRSNPSIPDRFGGRRKFEHWYRDNQVYFITARCRSKHPAFAGEHAKDVFWDRFTHYTNRYGFVPWVTSLLDNHYHTLGYLRRGDDLGPMMQRLHGSVAKLVNDILEAQVRSGQTRLSRRPLRGESASKIVQPNGRLTPFWKDFEHRDYMDGCIRDPVQGRRAYGYTLTQAERHGIVDDYRLYPHTKVTVALDAALRFASERGAFLEGVPYKRYESRA